MSLITLTDPQRESLLALARYRFNGCSAAQVALNRGMSSRMGSNVSQALDALVRHGLATTFDSHSGRRMWQITDKGAQRVQRWGAHGV